jgi:DNA-binding MarR family transcriptional regulator
MRQELLRMLGLNDKEIRVYNAVLKEPGLSPALLAQRVGINRTTVYSIARSLAEKGLLTDDLTRRPRAFSPTTTTDIKNLIAEEKNHSAEREKLLREFSEELAQNTAAKSYPVPKIRFIEEEKIEKFLYQETPMWLTALENLNDPVWWGFQDHTIAAAFKEWIDWQWKEAPETISLKLLTNHSEIEERLAGRYPRRTMRFWKDSQGFMSTTWVVEDYVVVLNTRQHPFYVYEIHDALLAQDLRELLKNIWNQIQ